MNHLVVFAFVLIISSVAGQEVLKSCLYMTNTASYLNPGSSCAYIEDAVRCAIIDSGLAEDNAKEEDIEGKRTWANSQFGDKTCSTTFDDVLRKVKAYPELLELQRCVNTGLENFFHEGSNNGCSLIEEVIECDIEALSLHEDNASEDKLMHLEQLANRYLVPFGCSKTFDELLAEGEN